MADQFQGDATLALALYCLDKRTKNPARQVYTPYPKQLEFHNCRALERMFSAGNQLGKTHSAAQEVAYHALGEYPSWWKGHVFDHAVSGWIGSAAYAAQRDASQFKLTGTPTPFTTPDFVGQGCIPRDRILNVLPTRGTSDAVDTLIIKHKSGRPSTIRFKTYDQEILKWAGASQDFIWFDEEPPEKIYNEGLARVSSTGGIIFTTYTPLSGRTPLVNKFVNEPNKDRVLIVMTAYDVAGYAHSHKTREEVDRFMNALPEWEREARIYGRPAAGEGKIFKVPESIYVIPPCELRTYWPRIIGLDFGMLHPTAAVWVAWDRDRNRLIVYDEYRVANTRAQEHAGNLLMRGAGEFPVAWPQDGYQREKGTGEALKDIYKKLGLNMMPVHAQHSSGVNGESLWSSVTDITNRLQTAQLVIFDSCRMLRDEIMVYHQKDGKIEEIGDDLIAAMRYAVMQHKKGVVPSGMSASERAFRKQTASQGIVPGLDISPWASLNS